MYSSNPFSSIKLEYVIVLHIIWLELYSQTPFLSFSFGPLLLIDLLQETPLSYLSMVLQYGSEYMQIVKPLLIRNFAISICSMCLAVLPIQNSTSYDMNGISQLLRNILYMLLLIKNISTWKQYKRLLCKINTENKNCSLSPKTEEMARLLSEMHLHNN